MFLVEHTSAKFWRLQLRVHRKHYDFLHNMCATSAVKASSEKWNSKTTLVLRPGVSRPKWLPLSNEGTNSIIPIKLTYVERTHYNLETHRFYSADPADQRWANAEIEVFPWFVECIFLGSFCVKLLRQDGEGNDWSFHTQYSSNTFVLPAIPQSPIISARKGSHLIISMKRASSQHKRQTQRRAASLNRNQAHSERRPCKEDQKQLKSWPWRVLFSLSKALHGRLVALPQEWMRRREGLSLFHDTSFLAFCCFFSVYMNCKLQQIRNW